MYCKVLYAISLLQVSNFLKEENRYEKIVKIMLMCLMFVLAACSLNSGETSDINSPIDDIDLIEDNPSTNEGNDSVSSRYIVTPVNDNDQNYRVDYSYTDGIYDVWYLYLGLIDYTPVSYQTAINYNGQTPISVSYTSSYETEAGVSKSTETSISNTTEDVTTDKNVHKIGGELEASFGAPFVSELKLKVNYGYEQEWSSSNSSSKNTSKTDTFETFKSWKESNTTTHSYTIGENQEKSGFYRLTLFSTSDVYATVVYDKTNDNYFYQYSAFARPDTLFLGIDYNQSPDFSGGDNKLVLEADEFENLPVPEINNQKMWTQISVGENHSLAIDMYGNLWAWGDNSYGQLGDGTTISKTTPVQIEIKNKIKIVEYDYSLGLKIDNNLLQYFNKSCYSKTEPISIST